MNRRTQNIAQPYHPVLALVVYATDEKFSDTYIESHEIHTDGSLLEGKPLKQSTLDSIVDVFFDERKDRVEYAGIMPPEILTFKENYGGSYNLVWYNPPQIRHIYFSESLKITSGKAWVPGLVYRVIGSNLYVFAYNDNGSRPTEETRLMHAPFHIVSINGSVCLGSAKIKKPTEKTYKNLIQYWEDLFWKSEFSHLASSTNPIKGNLSVVWNKLVKDNAVTWASIDELIYDEKLTIKNLLKS